jgi:hypothetical protein
MKLNKTYAIHVLVMFYEIEMFKEWVKGIQNMVEGIENPENIIIYIDYSLRQDFEKIDYNKLPENGYLVIEYKKQIEILEGLGTNVRDFILSSVHTNKKYNPYIYNSEPYSIARARRDFNYKCATMVDYLMWGETDSFFPRETFQVLERIALYTKSANLPKHVVTFAYRKMWDAGWSIMEHPEFTNEVFQDTDEWNLYNKASEKCYMSIEEMNKINKRADDFDIIGLNEPKFDGSCVVFSSDLIKSGVNIPHALLMSGEDTSIGWMAKKILGNNYSQLHVKNILRVHNRRHPNKRNYIIGEDNKMGFCGESDKGRWWKILEQMSKENLCNLDNPQYKFHTWEDYFSSI